MRRLKRLPIPLLFALAVAVGVAVTIIIQITALPPPPAVVAPIETSATDISTGSSSHILSVEAAVSSYVTYPTVAGFGKLQLLANTTGWYYYPGTMMVTVVRRSTGDAQFNIGNSKVYVREINTTHAFVFYSATVVGVVTKKVQVGATGWYVYHPVVTDFDSATANTIKNLAAALGLSYIDVFQPRADYLTFNTGTKTYNIYVDRFDSSGAVNRKGNVYYMSLNDMTPLSANSAVIVDRLVQIDQYNYALYPIWLLLYIQVNSNITLAITITPVR